MATDVRLWIKDQCVVLDLAFIKLLKTLVKLAEANADIIIPGYTHLQRAQPVSVAHHVLAYVEMFNRDRARFHQVADSANWCPLGSGAIAGTTLPIKREITAKLLGFVDAQGKARVTRNSMDAVADRDVASEFCFAAALCGVHLSRLAEDMILWSSAEFGFARLPDAFSTGSSLMPQKRNPDSMELVRGKAGRMLGAYTRLFTVLKGLPHAYDRDLQEDKERVFDAADTLELCLAAMAAMAADLTANPARMRAACEPGFPTATDLADYLVKKGLPFREAHEAVAQAVKFADGRGCDLADLKLDELQQFSSLIDKDVFAALTLEGSLKARRDRKSVV